jgi:hypothetical protein
VKKWDKTAKNIHILPVLCIVLHMYAFKHMYIVKGTQMKHNLGLHVAISANTYAPDAKKVLE